MIEIPPMLPLNVKHKDAATEKKAVRENGTVMEDSLNSPSKATSG